MNNKIFSRGLYVEGLKLCRPFGFGYVAITAILCFFDIINTIIDGYGTSSTSSATFLVCVCLAAPLMCLNVFHFLNSRNGSDFYHSAPCSRSALMISFGSAVMTWAVVPVVVHIILNILLGGFEYEYLEIIAMCVLMTGQVIASVLLAMSICSTVSSQIIVSLMIIFLPNLLIDIMFELVGQTAPIFVHPDFWLLDSGNNLCYSTVVGSLIGTYTNGLTMHSVIYTVGLTLIIGALALVCFNRRRSEIATSTAPNAVVQTIIRTMLAMVFCLYPCTRIVEALTSDSAFFYADDAIWYGIALVAYIMYEVLSKKGLRGVGAAWRSMLAGLVLLVALNVGMVTAPVMFARSICAVQPSVDEVQSISISHSSSSDYLMTRVSQIECDDAGVIESVTKQLGENISLINQGWGNQHLLSSGSYDSYIMKLTLKNGSVITRKVYFSYDNLDILAGHLSKNDAFVDAICYMPTHDEILFMGIENYHYNGSYNDPDLDDGIWDLYDTLSAEIEELGPQGYASVFSAEQLIESVYNKLDSTAHYVDSGYFFGNFTIHGTLNGKIPFSCWLDIGTYLPKTAQKYIELVNAESNFSLEQILTNADEYDYIEIVVDGGNLRDANGEYVYTETQYFTYSSDFEEKNDLDYFYESGLYQELVENEGEPVDVTKPFYSVSVYTHNYQTGHYTERGTVFIQAAEFNPVMLDWAYTGGYDVDLSNYYPQEDAVSNTDAQPAE